MRLSQENENRQRASNYQPSPSQRTQETVGLKPASSRSQRLRTREDFRRVKKYGKKITGHVVNFDLLSEKFPYPRLGVTVSKRFGSAVLRNRFKRRIREAFRHSYLSPGISIHVTPKKEGFVPSLKQLLEDFALCHI